MKISIPDLLCGSTIIILSGLFVYVTQEDDIEPIESQVLIANTTAIQTLNLTDKFLNFHYTPKNTQDFWIGGLDCSYSLNSSYFSNMANSKLYALEKSSKRPRLIFSGYENWFPICLAVEEITGKLYVGDLVQGGLTVHDFATGDSSVILGVGLLLCVAVAVDVEEKFVFVVDKYQILRLDLDGKNPKTIHHLPDKMNLDYSGRRFRNGPKKSRVYMGVDGMTLDKQRKRIYWAIAQKKIIESSDYNGDNKNIHFHDSTAMYFGEFRSSSNSLAFANGSVYWADPMERRIVKIKSLNEYEVIYEGLDYATMASCQRREMIIKNPCEVENGGCQQLCLLSRSHYDGYSCACKFGYEIDEDGKNCRVIKDFLVFLEGGAVKGMSLTENPAYVFQPPGFRANENSFIDFDVESGLVYYTEKVSDENKLYEKKIDGTGQPKALTPDLFSKQLSNFAYDWTTKNLYYLSQYYSDAMTLCVTNAKNPTYSKVLVKNLFDGTTTMRFFGPVVHPNRGYLFLIVIGGKSGRGEIKRMMMDGSDFTVIYKVGEKNAIGGLTVDYEDHRIYWGEVRESDGGFWQSSIKSSNLNGNGIRGFDLTKDIEMPIGMTIHKGQIYCIDVGKRLFRIDKDGNNLKILAESGHFSYNVRIHSSDVQVTRDDHPCKSHKCQKFCFVVPSGLNGLTATCGCPYGEKIADDGVSCVKDLKNQPVFKACDDKSSCKII